MDFAFSLTSFLKSILMIYTCKLIIQNKFGCILYILFMANDWAHEENLSKPLPSPLPRLRDAFYKVKSNKTSSYLTRSLTLAFPFGPWKLLPLHFLDIRNFDGYSCCFLIPSRMNSGGPYLVSLWVVYGNLYK